MENLLQIIKESTATYFDVMIPMLPNICNIYNIRHPTFHLRLVKHNFAEQRIDYQLTKLLNTNESTTFTLKAQPLSKITFLITMLTVVI